MQSEPTFLVGFTTFVFAVYSHFKLALTVLLPVIVATFPMFSVNKGSVPVLSRFEGKVGQLVTSVNVVLQLQESAEVDPFLSVLPLNPFFSSN